jgi:hypothetical protein
VDGRVITAQHRLARLLWFFFVLQLVGRAKRSELRELREYA